MHVLAMENVSVLRLWIHAQSSGSHCLVLGLASHQNKASRDWKVPARSLTLLLVILALDEAFFDHLLVAEPQIGDVG